jgi:hypothetical protein
MHTATSKPVIETLGFSEAKGKLSELMTSVVHDHQLKAVGRHRGKEEMLLVGREEFLALLETFEFHPKVSVSAGEFIVRLPELGLIGAGSSLDEAYDELAELAEVYAENYLDRLDFFRHTDRRRQLPWVARIAFTPPPSLRELLTPQVERTAQPV